MFGSSLTVRPEKVCAYASKISFSHLYATQAILANASAVREWDANGTVFGFNERMGPEFQAGEFGHNDFYPVVVAACETKVCSLVLRGNIIMVSRYKNLPTLLTVGVVQI